MKMIMLMHMEDELEPESIEEKRRKVMEQMSLIDG